MIRSALKVIREAVLLYLGGIVASIPLVVAFADGSEIRPLGFHLGRIACAVVWYFFTAWFYRKDGLGKMWFWGKASVVSKAGAVGVIAAGVLGAVLGQRQQYAMLNLRSLLNPLDSLALSACIIGPFMEEIFWRGFLLRRLSPIIGTWQATAFSSVVFGLCHSDPLPAIARGATLGWLYSPYATGNLYVPILYHILINLGSRLPSY